MTHCPSTSKFQWSFKHYCFHTSLIPLFCSNRLGGSDLEDSLTYHVLNTTNIGKYQYVMAGNLLSYVIKERTGQTPEEYAKEKALPFLGITDADYEWYVNQDQVQTSFHGLKMTTVALSKLGMLYLQNGMANDNKQIVDPSWIERSWTVGDETASEKFGFIGWWLGTVSVAITLFNTCHTLLLHIDLTYLFNSIRRSPPTPHMALEDSA